MAPANGRSGAENFGEVGGPISAKTTHLTFLWGSPSPCTGLDRGRVRKSEWHQNGNPCLRPRRHSLRIIDSKTNLKVVYSAREDSPDSPSAFRPVCLLDEAGKLLERVVAARLQSHLIPDCTTTSLAFGGDDLRPTLSPVSAPWSRGPNGVVAWRWPCHWT